MTDQARYICKHCGAESPPGIGNVLQLGEEPTRSEPDPDCVHPHLRPGYAISITTWDHGHGHTEALSDGPVKDHLLGLGQRALGFFPEIDQVVYRCKASHSEITVYRREVT